LESVEGVQQIFLRKRNEKCAKNVFRFVTCYPEVKSCVIFALGRNGKIATTTKRVEIAKIATLIHQGVYSMFLPAFLSSEN